MSTQLNAASLTVADVLLYFERASVAQGVSRVWELERRRWWSRFDADYGALPVADCTPETLLEFIDKHAGALSNWTRRRIVFTVRGPFEFAKTQGLITSNPFRSVWIPRGRTAPRWWTEAEFRAAMRNCRPNFRRLLLFSWVTAARPQEIRRLKWSTVREAVNTLNLDPFLALDLADPPPWVRCNRIALALIEFQARQPNRGDFVFTTKIGTPWKNGAVTAVLRDTRRRAQLPTDLKFHGCHHPEAARAMFDTLAYGKGVSVQTTSAPSIMLPPVLLPPVPERNGEKPPKPPGLNPKYEETFQAVQWAIAKIPEFAGFPDKTVWEWLRKRADCPFKVPKSFLTHQQQMSRARRFHGVAKRILTKGASHE
jgi:integrase